MVSSRRGGFGFICIWGFILFGLLYYFFLVFFEFGLLNTRLSLLYGEVPPVY